MTNDNSFILDTPNQIELYRIIATRNGLELELKMQASGWAPTACPTRGLALRSARAILAQYKVPGPSGTRPTALRGMRQLCQTLGIAPSRQEQQEQAEAVLELDTQLKEEV